MREESVLNLKLGLISSVRGPFVLILTWTPQVAQPSEVGISRDCLQNFRLNWFNQTDSLIKEHNLENE